METNQSTTTWIDNVFVFIGVLVLIIIAQLYIQIFLMRTYDIFLTEEEIEEVKQQRFGAFAEYVI